ncbi:UNVERIFIED_ORG: P pilus assembly chaperone PapD [Buttiauxella agrestis ATCC 33320]
MLMLAANSVPVQAGVVIGGTRFVYGEKQQSITVLVRNKSPEPYLLKTKILPGGGWAGVDKPEVTQEPFIATPPLFVLQGGRENKIRLIRTSGSLPSDRESLFTLSIASIPSGKAGSESVQMAIRSAMKLIYRPAGLNGNPENAYAQLEWSRTDNMVMVKNPTPYYVTLFQLNSNGHTVDEAGVVAPFSQRTENWCDASKVCHLRWQTINDYGHVMPAVALAVSGSTPTSAAGQYEPSSP